MGRAVIIASYLEHPVDIPRLLEPDDYIVCLDGGYDIALQQGVKPHMLLGDFDSMQVPFPEDPAIEIRRYPPEKDYTDLELAFRILDPEKTPEILVIGALGGRLDQTLTNVQMLAQYTSGAYASEAEQDQTPQIPRYRRIQLQDGHNKCFAICGDGTGTSVCQIPREPNSYLSLLPMSDWCRGVTLKGAKYPLEDADIQKGVSFCVSNEFRGPQAELTLRSGTLLVIVAQGNSGDRL